MGAFPRPQGIQHQPKGLSPYEGKELAGHAKIETTEGVAASGGTPRSATMENPLPQIVSDILGERSVKHGQSRPPAGRDVIHQNPV